MAYNLLYLADGIFGLTEYSHAAAARIGSRIDEETETQTL